MTKSELKGILSRALNSNNTLTLPTDLNDIPDFTSSFEAYFGEQQITVSDHDFDIGAVMVTGTSNYWNVEVAFSMQFIVKNGNPHYKIEMEFADDWKITNSFPNFIENKSVPIFGSSRLLFNSSNQVPDIEMLDNFERDSFLYFITEQAIEGALTPVKWLLGEAPALEMVGPVTVEKNLPDMELVAHIADTVKFDFFNDLNVAFVWNSQVIETDDSAYNQVFFEIQTFIPFRGKDLIFKAAFVNDLGALNFTVELEDVTLNNLNALKALTNDSDLMAALPDGLNIGNHIGLQTINLSVIPKTKSIASIDFTLGTNGDWTVIDGFDVNNLSLEIVILNPGRKTQRSISTIANGGLEIGSSQLAFTANYPEKIISAQLAKDSTIPVSDLASKVFPVAEFPNLEISALEINLDVGNKSVTALTQIDMGWGLNFGSNSIQLQNIQLELEKQGTDKRAYLAATSNFLGLEFVMSGDYQGTEGGWTFSGISQPQDELLLSTLIASVLDFFGINIPLYHPEISLSQIEVTFNTVSKRLFLAATSKLESKLPIAGVEFNVETSVAIQSAINQQTKKRSLLGTLYARLELLEDFFFDLKYSMQDEHPVISGSWQMESDKSLSFDDLLVALGIDKIDFPDPISKALVETLRGELLDRLALTAVAFDFNVGTKSFSLQANTELFGTLLFISHRNTASRKWEQIFGLELPPNSKLSDIPGLKDELSATDFMNFQNVALMLSTSELNGSSFPTMPTISDTEESSFLEGTSLYLSKGVNVAAKISLDGDDAAMKNLGGATGLQSLTIQSGLGNKELNFRSSLGDEIDLSIGDDSLGFKDPYVQLDVLPKFGLQLGGSLMINFNDTLLRAEGRLIISPVEISGAMMVSAHDPDSTDTSAANATGNLLEPMGIKGIKLNSIGFIVGATFFPPGVKFGMQAGFQIGDQAPSVNQLAMIMQVIPAVPTPVLNLQLLSFQLEEMDIETMLVVFTNDNAPAELPEFLGAVRATDIGFNYCSAITTLPDGNTALPGFGFHGNVNILGFKARAALNVSAISGISGDFQMSPIDISVGDVSILSVRGKGREISNHFEEQPDGTWKKITNEEALLPGESDSSLPAPNTRTEVIMDAGGPVLQFDTNGPQYLFGSVEVTFFDFISTTIEAEISQSGMRFLYNYAVSDILDIGFNLTVNWAGDNPGFIGHAYFDLDLDVEIPLPFGLPSIELDAGLNASATLKVDASGFSFKINGGFEFEGTEFTLPELEFTVAFSSLKNIGEMIIDHIKDKAWEIFKEIFAFLEEAWEDFKEGVSIAYEATKELVEDIGKGAVEIAEKAIEIAEEAVEAVEEVLEDIGEEIVQAYETGKKFVEDVGKEIVEIGKKAVEVFEDLVEEAEVIIEAAVEFAKKAFESARKFVEKIGQDIIAIGKAAVEAVKQLARAAAQAVRAILRVAEEAVRRIWNGIKNLVAGLLRAAKALEDLAKAIWNEINAFFEAAAKAIEDAAEEVGDWVSGAASDVGNALEDAFSGY